MRTVTVGFQAAMIQPTQNALYRRFIYGGTDYSAYPKTYGPITLDAKQIIAGTAIMDLINSDQSWSNMLLTTPTLLRQSGTIELGIDVGGVPQYVTFFTGELDGTHFISDYVSCQFRNRMMTVLDETVGSTGAAVDYFTTGPEAGNSYNPADMAWSILTTYGGLTAADRDLAIWQAWWTDCNTMGLRLEGNFTGQTIRWILRQIAWLSTSIIFVRGDDQFVFYRYVPSLAAFPVYNDNNTHLVEVKQTLDELLNQITCWYEWDPNATPPAWIGGSTTVNDPISQAQPWGIIAHTEDSTTLWHYDLASATEFCNRTLLRYANPLELCSFDTGLQGFINEPGDLIALTMNFFNYSSTIFEIRKVIFNLNLGKVRIEAVNAASWTSGVFILDHAVHGLLDQNYNPLY